MSAARSAGEGDWSDVVQDGASEVADLAHGLAEVLPGFHVLDRDLVFDGDRRASLVGVEDAGRLVLVLDARGEEEDRLCLTVLDALAWARGQRALVARHLSEARLDPDAEPLVAVVGAAFSPLFLRRLGPLCPDAVVVLERRELSSERARSAFLVPLVPTTGSDRRVPQNFLERLDENQQRRADLLVRRLRRVDEGVTCAGSDGRLRWTFRGVELCEVSDEPRGLIGRVAGRHDPLLLAGDEALEAFLDAALARYVRIARELSAGEHDAESEEPTVLVPRPAPPG